MINRKSTENNIYIGMLKRTLGIFVDSISNLMGTLFFDMIKTETNSNNEVVIKNKGKTLLTRDAILYGSNAIKIDSSLGESLEVKISYQLGRVIQHVNQTNVNVVMSDVLLNTYVLTIPSDLASGTEVSNQINILQNNYDTLHELKCNIKCIQGNVNLKSIETGDGAGDIKTFLIDKTMGINALHKFNEEIYLSDLLSNGFKINFTDDINVTSGGVLQINFTLKKISTNNSFVSYISPTTGKLITYTNENTPHPTRPIIPNSKTFIIKESFQAFFPHDIPFVDEDVVMIESNPNILMNIWFNGYTLPSGFNKENMVIKENNVFIKNSFIPATEAGDMLIYDLGDPAIPIIFSIETTVNDESITIDVVGSGIENYFEIFWGDGTKELFKTIGNTNPIHIYNIPGIYEITISGRCEKINFHNMKDKLTSFDSLGETRLKTLVDFMYENELIKTPNVSNTDISNVTSLSSTFRNMPNITTPPDVSNWDTNNVTSLYCTFFNIPNITTPPDVSNWDTSNVTSLSNTFFNMTNVTTPPDISNWDTGNVTNLSYTFRNMSNITTPPDVSNWDISNVTSLSNTFYNMSNITTPPDVSNWDTSNVTNLYFTFRNMTNVTTPPDISNWDTGNVTNLSYTFYNMAIGNEISDLGIHNWNIGKVSTGVYFLQNANLVTVEYDQVLINWEAQSHLSNVIMDFGLSKYTLGGDAETARNALIADGWTINDGGGV